jgi:hypothetical protein
MSSMCARNGQERSHTRATLLFIVLHQIPTVMSKKSTCSTHTWTVHVLGPDGPPYTQRLYSPFKICQSCQKS